jgi:hypothetical protein
MIIDFIWIRVRKWSSHDIFFSAFRMPLNFLQSFPPGFGQQKRGGDEIEDREKCYLLALLLALFSRRLHLPA